MRRVRSLVSGDHAAHRQLTWQAALTALVGMSAWLLAVLADGIGSAWLGVPIGALAGCYVCWAALAWTRAARAYRDGWAEGRRAFVLSMGEAQARGLTGEEWVTAELERDMTMLLGREGAAQFIQEIHDEIERGDRGDDG